MIMEHRKFTGKKFMSKGVAESVPAKLQQTLWNAIDEAFKVCPELDSLQVFQIIDVEGGFVKVRHTQTSPSYDKMLTIDITDFTYGEVLKLKGKKILVIDESSYSVMLLTEEY